VIKEEQIHRKPQKETREYVYICIQREEIHKYDGWIAKIAKEDRLGEVRENQEEDIKEEEGNQMRKTRGKEEIKAQKEKGGMVPDEGVWLR